MAAVEHLLVPLPQRAEDIFNPQEAAAYFRTCTNLKTITVLFNRCRVDTELRILGYRRGQRGEPLAVLIPDNAAIFCQVPLSFFLGLASTLKVSLNSSHLWVRAGTSFLDTVPRIFEHSAFISCPKSFASFKTVSRRNCE